MQDKKDSTVIETSEPFFARFLESQENVKGPDHTLKFPSDSDEWILRAEFTSATDK